MRSPRGFLGIQWGDEPSLAVARLGLSCEGWEPWEGNNGYEVYFDIRHPVDAFDRQAYARIIRKQDRVEGLSLRFLHCGKNTDSLAEAIRKTLNLKKAQGPLYTVFHDGGAVRLEYNSGDDSCEVTIAGPMFGKAFVEYVLAQGFWNFSLGPR